jgi:hypothetical protein
MVPTHQKLTLKSVRTFGAYFCVRRILYRNVVVVTRDEFDLFLPDIFHVTRSYLRVLSTGQRPIRE